MTQLLRMDARRINFIGTGQYPRPKLLLNLYTDFRLSA